MGLVSFVQKRALIVVSHFLLTPFAVNAQQNQLALPLNSVPHLRSPSHSEVAASCGVNQSGFLLRKPQTEAVTAYNGSMGDGATVNYTAFSGSNYVMRQFLGKHTALLIRPEDLLGFGIPQVREMIDQQDYLYEMFRELMGTEPQGDGPLRVAFVPNDYGYAGQGYVGQKGLELQTYFATGGVWFAKGNIPDLYAYLNHEMTHNFDRWGSYVMFGSDVAHAWTGFMDAYIRSWNQQGENGNNPEALLRRRTEDFFNSYLAFAGGSWTSCVRNASCAGVDATATQSGFACRLAQISRGSAARRAMLELRDAATTRGLNPGSMTPEQKNDLLLECFSRGGQTNLGCLVNPLNWTISTSMLAQLNALFGTNHSFCVDGDNDGYTPLQGDLDDTNPTVFPGAVEVANGVDDDCNGVVDDVVVTEGSDYPNNINSALNVPFPCRIQGVVGASSDEDFFRINIATQTRVRFTTKSLGTFAGWLFIHEADGAWKTYSYIGAGGRADLDVLLEAGTWRFSLGYGATPGPYEVIALPIQEWPLNQYPPSALAAGSNAWTLKTPVVPDRLLGETNLSVRFWISECGWISTNSVTSSNGVSFTWSPPVDFDVSTGKYRAQFYVDGLPADRATEARPLLGGYPLFPEWQLAGFTLKWPGAAEGLHPYTSLTPNGSWSKVTNEAFFTNRLLNNGCLSAARCFHEITI